MHLICFEKEFTLENELNRRMVAVYLPIILDKEFIKLLNYELTKSTIKTDRKYNIIFIRVIKSIYDCRFRCPSVFIDWFS